MERCRCGREYYPRQAWIHVPLCRYLDETPVNHISPELRVALTVQPVVVNNPVVERWPVNTEKMDRKQYMREYMRRKRGS
jgi:hypothetical protein